MNFEPLTGAIPPIPSHALVAVGALLLGGVQLYLPKFGARHRWMGRVWVAMLAYVAVSGFFIHGLNMFYGFSVIHLVSVFTLIILILGLRAAQQKNIKRHEYIMKSLYFYALIVTALFTFWPGRVMYLVFWG